MLVNNCLSVFQFDWHLMNRINSGAVLHCITFSPSGLLLFTLWRFRASGSSLLQSRRVSAPLVLSYFGLVLKHNFLPSIFTPEIFCVLHSPVSTRLHTFSFRSSNGYIFGFKYLFSFSPVGILPSVWSFSSSSGMVQIGLYPFLSDVSGFSISKSLSSSISPSSLSDSDSDFRIRFWIIFSLPFGISRNISFH